MTASKMLAHLCMLICWACRSRSYKGSALALLVEILGGALAGGAVEAKVAARNWGSLVAAVDPAALGDAAAFRARVSALLRRVKAARRAPGVSEIRLPGENSEELAGAPRVSLVPFPLSLLMGLYSWVGRCVGAPGLLVPTQPLERLMVVGDACRALQGGWRGAHVEQAVRAAAHGSQRGRHAQGARCSLFERRRPLGERLCSALHIQRPPERSSRFVLLPVISGP